MPSQVERRSDMGASVLSKEVRDLRSPLVGK